MPYSFDLVLVKLLSIPVSGVLFSFFSKWYLIAYYLSLHPFLLHSFSLGLSLEVWLPAQPGSLFSRPEAPCMSVPEGQHWQAASASQEGASRSTFWAGMTHGRTHLGASPVSSAAKDESVSTWKHADAYICAYPHHRCPVNVTHFPPYTVSMVKLFHNLRICFRFLS